MRQRSLNLFTVAVPSRPEYPTSGTGMYSKIQRPQHHTVQVRKVHRLTGYGHIPFQQCPFLLCPEWSHCWYLLIVISNPCPPRNVCSHLYCWTPRSILKISIYCTPRTHRTMCVSGKGYQPRRLCEALCSVTKTRF